MIVFYTCERVLIESLHLMNSPMFHMVVGNRSSNITVRGVTVRAPASDDPVDPSYNTDACNIGGTNVLVENCDISTGDDNFACDGYTSDVLIRNNTYGNGHGVSIGSPTRGGCCEHHGRTLHVHEHGFRILFFAIAVPALL